MKITIRLNPGINSMRLPKIDNGITITHKKTSDLGVVSHLKSPSEFIFDALTQRHAKNLSAQLGNLLNQFRWNGIIDIEPWRPVRINLRDQQNIAESTAQVAEIVPPERKADHIDVATIT